MEEINNPNSLKFLDEAKRLAEKSTCERSKCGSVIVYNREIIGRGFNSPPLELDSQKRCNVEKDSYHKKVTDKTCCIHAEQRAMFDALRNNPEKLKGSDLYFIRLNKEDEMSYSGKPYCTICSKMALDLGIKNFILYLESGVTSYDTKEYNDLSYEYNGN